MSLSGNDNRSPRTGPLTREDVLDIVKDVVGEVRRDMAEESQKRAAEAQAKAPIPAPKQGNVFNRKKILDPLATKAPEDMTSMELATMHARWLKCLFHARNVGGGVPEMLSYAKEHGQETLVKAMGASDFDDGGFLVEPAFASGVIMELEARVQYIKAGPQILTLPQGGMVLPYESDGADAQWGAENTEVSAEEIKGGQIHLQPKKLLTVVGVSNDLLRAPPGVADSFVVESMLRGMRVKLDATLLRGVGASSEPMGLGGLVPSAHEHNVTAEVSLTQAQLIEELLLCQTDVETDNIDLALDRPHYFMSPRTKNYLRAQRATDGVLLPEMAQGQLLGAGYSATSNIPNNVSASYSEIYFVAMAHMILGQSQDMRVDVFPGGTYNNSSGTKVSGISADQTVVRTIGAWDHAAGQRGNEISRLNNVDWT